MNDLKRKFFACVMMYLILVYLIEVFITLRRRNPFFDQKWVFWHSFDAHALQSTCIIFARFADDSVAMLMLSMSEDSCPQPLSSVWVTERSSVALFLFWEICDVGTSARFTDNRISSNLFLFISLYILIFRASSSVIPPSSSWGVIGEYSRRFFLKSDFYRRAADPQELTNPATI